MYQDFERDHISEIEFMDIFGDNLREIMYEKNITQRQLSEISGVSEGSISNFINKKKMISLKSLNNISKALGCEIQELLPYEGDIFIY